MKFSSCKRLLHTDSSRLINIERNLQYIIKTSSLCWKVANVFRQTFLEVFNIISLTIFQTCSEIFPVMLIWHTKWNPHQNWYIPIKVFGVGACDVYICWLISLVFEKNHYGISLHYIPLLQHQVFHTSCAKNGMTSSTKDIRAHNQWIRTILVNGYYGTKSRCNSLLFLMKTAWLHTLPIWPKAESIICMGSWVSVPSHNPKGVISQTKNDYLFKFLRFFHRWTDFMTTNCVATG